jgi:hypothetical protein
MKLRLLEPHVIEDAWRERGYILDPPPPGYAITPLMEGLDDEGKAAVAQARLAVWGRYPTPYGLYPPGYGGARPLDDPPIPRPLDDNQPGYHYVGCPEYGR